jgi:hypothetical protein
MENPLLAPLGANRYFPFVISHFSFGIDVLVVLLLYKLDHGK